MKIVHVAEYASGGVATYLRNLLELQINDSRVDEVTLINSKLNSEKFDFDSSKFKNYTYQYERSLSGIFKLLKLRGLIDSLKPDVVHFHSSFAGLVRLTYLFKDAKYQVVYCAHGWSFLQKDKKKIYRKIYSKIELLESRKTNLIINISDDEEKEALLRGLPREKMKVVYNSISGNDTKLNIKNPYSNNKNKKLLFIGRFDKQKGLDLLLNSVNFSETNMELAVIGKPIVTNNVNKYVDSKNVKYLGWIDNKYVNSYISCCDAVVIPSLWEGFGLVALEAMKNRKMVISSDAGGLNELVLDNFNGLKFKSGSKKALSLKLKEFENMSDEEILKLGSNGFDLFKEKYDIENLYNLLMSYYES